MHCIKLAYIFFQIAKKIRIMKIRNEIKSENENFEFKKQSTAHDSI